VQTRRRRVSHWTGTHVAHHERRETDRTYDALRDLLPPEPVAEWIDDVFPRQAIGEAFRKGLALFFSPLTGFWRVLREAMRRLRRDDGEQYAGAE
jgi:hypothetical protein